MSRNFAKAAATKLFRALSSPTGLTCSGLALICGSISGNALLLQGARHPSPLFASREEPEVNRHAGQGDLIVEAVQQSLTEAGFYSGPVDGFAGPQTRAAIIRFEQATGRPETGEPTPDLIASLSDWSAGPARPPDQNVSPASATSHPDVLAVQSALARAAYGPLTTDGVFGEETRDAIIRFQLDQGMPLTGKIDAELIRRLQNLGALDGA